MKRALSTVVLGLAVAGSAGCTPPCASLKPPSERELSLMKEGVEISRQVGEIECELDATGRWRVD